MLEQAKEEVRKLIELYEKDLEVVTHTADYEAIENRILGLYDALEVLGGSTAEEVY